MNRPDGIYGSVQQQINTYANFCINSKGIEIKDCRHTLVGNNLLARIEFSHPGKYKICVGVFGGNYGPPRGLRPPR